MAKTKKSVLAQQFAADSTPAPESAAQITASPLDNNPVMIIITGMSWLFKRAMSVAIFLLVVSFVFEFINFTPLPLPSLRERTPFVPYVTHFLAQLSPEQIILFISIGMIALVIALGVGFIIQGIADYTSAQIAHGSNVTLGAAWEGLRQRFWSYVWVISLAQIKIFLWSLLLIVPGIIMGLRYSLAGVVFFAEEKQANAAIRRSAHLTKGGLITLFTSTVAMNFLVFGFLGRVLCCGATTVLYYQFNELDHLGQHTKPSPHWVAWVLLAGCVLFFVILTGLMILAVLLHLHLIDFAEQSLL